MTDQGTYIDYPSRCGECRHSDVDHSHLVSERTYEFRGCKRCHCLKWVPGIISDPLANNPRVQATRKLVKERGVVSSKEIDEYMEAERVAKELVDQGISIIEGERSKEFEDEVASQFVAQIKDEMKIPRPPCSTCNHIEIDHWPNGSCAVRSTYGGQCSCLQYEPKQFDEEPTQPLTIQGYAVEVLESDYYHFLYPGNEDLIMKHHADGAKVYEATLQLHNKLKVVTPEPYLVKDDNGT